MQQSNPNEYLLLYIENFKVYMSIFVFMLNKLHYNKLYKQIIELGQHGDNILINQTFRDSFTPPYCCPNSLTAHSVNLIKRENLYLRQFFNCLM